jgi:hypothetical protein
MKKKKKELTEEDNIEEILDSTWDNWSSRRKCESTHVPEFIKKQED